MHPAKKQAWVNSSYGFVALFYIFLTTSPSAAGTTLGPVRNVVFMGRPFIANPDLVERMKNNWPIATPDRATFYGNSGEKGYVDYPFHSPNL